VSLQPEPTEPTPQDEGVTESLISREISPAPATATIQEGAAQKSIFERMRASIPEIPELFTFSIPVWINMGLVGTWVLLAGFRLALLGWQLIQLRRFKRRAMEASPSELKIFGLACEELQLNRKPGLRISTEIKSPMAVGFFRPAVLLPANCGMSDGELRNLFRHELAHLKRGDDWANLIQQIIKAVLFFHPGILILSRRLSVEREIACDDVVLSAEASRRSYALFLTEFAGRASSRDWSAAPAAWSNKTQLKERVDMILNTKRNASPRMARTKSVAVSAAAVLLGILAVQAGPRVALAGEAESYDSSKALPTPSVVAVAENSPADVETTEPETGPRIKASRAGSTVTIEAGRPPEGLPPGPDHRPLFDGKPTPPPSPHDHPGRRMRDGKTGRDGSLEERLDRLEALVDSLVRENRDLKEGRREDFAFNFKTPRWEGKTFEYKPYFAPTPEDLERLKRDALSNAEKAMREAERARRDAERDADRARKEAGKNFNRNQLDAQRNAIEMQRHSIEKAMQSLERQLNELERQQERLNEQFERPERPEKPEKMEKAEKEEKPEKLERN
jgi:beta-lactamase regulating signal transducer with metallopeptidase domain